MKSLISSLIGFVLSVSVGAAPLIEGRVRLDSGESVEAAQVRIFDMTDLQRGAVAQATTDATGYFALPLAALTGSVLPTSFTLGQNYPNPFNPSTIIPYQVPTAAHVQLEVFNVLGQRVVTLVDEERSAGVYTAVWDATDATGRAVGAGVYFYRLSSAGHPSLTRRMVLIDGQAGQVAASVPLPQAQATAPAAERVYGLAVTGAGLVTYVDASFGVRSGMAPVEVVVDAVAGLPRGKALTGGVLGDVNGDGQVTLDDALLVTTYVVNGSVELPANGDLALGDVNGDGQVTLDDAQLLTAYVTNPADGSLPAGIGQAVSSSGGDWVAGAIRRLTDDSAWDSWPTWSPDGRHLAFASDLAGNDEIYVMGSDGSNLRRLTDDSASDYAPTWSPDGQHIAFVSSRTGRRDIYVMGSDGSNLRRLTDDSASDYAPAWSPDGQHIAFMSSRTGNDEIYVMDSDGSNLRRLTDDSGYDDHSPTWSPDGRHIAFVSYRDDNWDIYVMGSDGSNLRRLTDDSGRDESPTWSPDGRHIAFESYRDGNWDIYVMGSDGSNPRRLTDDSGSDYAPTWSPDGQHIAFVSIRDRYNDNNTEIYMMGSDGSNPRRLTYHSALDSSPTWSPDGQHIAFMSDRDTDNETYKIYVMELRQYGSGKDWTAGTIHRLTYHPASDSSPTWSPDGRHIAFVSSRDGNAEVYVMDSDGSNLRRLTDDSAEDRYPSWSPDGHHIAFESVGGIYVMGSDGSNRRHLTTDGRYPSWSPDGHHIAFESVGGIYVMGSDGSNRRRLWSGSGSSPTWSPDGHHIALAGRFRSRNENDTSDEIYVMNVNSTDYAARRLTDNSAEDRYPSWSPDGHHIAFLSLRWVGRGSVTFDVYVMGSDGSNPRRLATSADASPPSWSPDGRHIAFSAYPDGNREIYVMELREASSFDDGDSPATATPVVVGDPIEGELSADDSDYFRVTVNNRGLLVASTTGFTDTYGSIEDSSGNILNENDSGGEGSNFRVSAAVEPGTYYIGVRGFGGLMTGSYTLRVDHGDLVEYNTPTLVRQHDDRVIVMGIPSRLTIDPIDFDALTQVFFDHYEDAFDYLMVFSNLSDIRDNQYYKYYGIHLGVQNTVQGTGKHLPSRNQAVGSEGKLNAILHFPYNEALLYGPSLHEIMHSWANYAIPTVVDAHWGFSSANGQLGGFDRTNLIDHGGGRYSAGRFGTFANGGNSLPYSPIELYFAGLISPSEVPDLWVAEDGEWLGEDDSSGNPIFTALQVSTWSIDRIVAIHGARLPDSSRSQKQFRAALILLVDQLHPTLQSTLDRLSAEVQQFTNTGSDDDFARFNFLMFNFWEATGGRATLTMDGLSAYRRSGRASKPVVSYRIVEPVANQDGHIGCVPMGDATEVGKWMVAPSDKDKRITLLGHPSVSQRVSRAGRIELPTKPGLGFDLIESEVEKTKEFR